MTGPTTTPMDLEAERALDDAARARIAQDLNTNLLVEAGAGSGKTTSLVGRIVALVERGTPIDRVAAVTFTRKAANELRERCQIALETGLREAEPGSERALRLGAALRGLDHGFLGTIHSFCGRLLRERPLEAGLDPSFEELDELAWAESVQTAWRRWVERTEAEGDPDVAALRAVGIEPRSLGPNFERVAEQADVAFPAPLVDPPDVAPLRRTLEALVADASDRINALGPVERSDDLMGLVRQLLARRRFGGWEGTARFMELLTLVGPSRCKVTQKCWGDTKDAKAEAKALGEAFEAFRTEMVVPALAQSRAHCYPIVLRYLQRAARDFETSRRAAGRLGFSDLLLLTAQLLRDNADARDALGARWRHLLVDEFQDTDPVQAELCLLLASPSSEGVDWRAVTPRPGALFVVGDPKQSIYRFRRADIAIYDTVKRRMGEVGGVVALTRNFRSTDPIAALVNAHFATVFGDEATELQAPFRAMLTERLAEPGRTLLHYTVGVAPNSGEERVAGEDAELLADWIADRVERGERKAGDFLILTRGKKTIAAYARALASRNVPVSTTGALLPQEHELREILVVLRALADPENPILVAAALEGIFFGCSPADLWAAKEAGLGFSAARRPADDVDLPAASALRLLHEWWKASQRSGAAALVDRLIDDTGLLAYATSQSLGEARAGALLRIVSLLHAAEEQGGGLPSAIELLELLLSREAPDAPLRAGQLDAVRVMNLHKAKGLEAPVVILAAPADDKPKPARMHVKRGVDGAAQGYLCLTNAKKEPIAHPHDWSALMEEEARFLEAEKARLLYVAATRAREELVVGRCRYLNKSAPRDDRSWWRPLAAPCDLLGAAAIAGPGAQATVRRTLEVPATTMVERVARAVSTVQRSTVTSLRHETVTERAKSERADARAYDLPVATGLGKEWGSAVHRTIEAIGRGRRGAGLRAFGLAVLRDEGVAETEIDALLEAATQATESEGWRLLSAAGTPAFELPVMRTVVEDEVLVVQEGVIDAAVRDGQGWTVVDWKTDGVSETEWAKRVSQYEAQANGYAELLAAVDGQGATARGIVQRIMRSAS